MNATAQRRTVALKVDPAFIVGVIFLGRSCSIKDMATILGCDRKRVLSSAPATARSPRPRASAAPPSNSAASGHGGMTR